MRQLLWGERKIAQIGQTESRRCIWILREAKFVQNAKHFLCFAWCVHFATPPILSKFILPLPHGHVHDSKSSHHCIQQCAWGQYPCEHNSPQLPNELPPVQGLNNAF